MSDITFDITRLVPKFLLKNRTGYALAMAINAALRYTAERAQAGIDLMLDADTMPEWRLDELARERDLLYDYNADVETKRFWIKNADEAQLINGTRAALYRFLEGAAQSVSLEEWFEYGGEPYHFRVTLSGGYSADNIAWAQKAISGAKNLRSLLDAVTIDSGSNIVVSGEFEYFPYSPRYVSNLEYTQEADD